MSPVSPEFYEELLMGMGLSAEQAKRNTYAHCGGCGLQGYEHFDRDCGAFTPAIDAESGAAGGERT